MSEKVKALLGAIAVYESSEKDYVFHRKQERNSQNGY